MDWISLREKVNRSFAVIIRVERCRKGRVGRPIRYKNATGLNEIQLSYEKSPSSFGDLEFGFH